jgi:hypothetical protein
MDALGAIPGGRLLAGAKNAVAQSVRSGAGISKIPVAGVKTVRIGGDVAKVGDKVLKINGKAMHYGGEVFKPISQQMLKSNPKVALGHAAEFAHANGVKIANWMPGINIQSAFSTGGIIAGTVVNSGIKIGINQGISYGEHKVKEMFR